MEVAGTIARRKSDRVIFSRCENALLVVKFPDINRVQAKIHMQYKPSGGVGLNHVGMGPVVATEGEAAWRSVFRSGRANFTGIVFQVSGFAQTSIGKDRQNGNRATKIIGNQQEPARGMDTDIGRPVST